MKEGIELNSGNHKSREKIQRDRKRIDNRKETPK